MEDDLGRVLEAGENEVVLKGSHGSPVIPIPQSCDASSDEEQSIVLVIHQDETGDVIEMLHGSDLRSDPGSGLGSDLCQVNSLLASKKNTNQSKPPKELSTAQAKLCARAFVKPISEELMMSTNSTKQDVQLCAECGKDFPTEPNLMLHWISAHSNSAYTQHTDSVDNGSATNNTSHKQAPHHATAKDDNNITTPISDNTLSKRLLLCPYCERGYTNIIELQNHVRIHENDGTLNNALVKYESLANMSPPFIVVLPDDTKNSQEVDNENRDSENIECENGSENMLELYELKIDLALEIATAITQELDFLENRRKRKLRQQMYKYRCKICGIWFTLPDSALRHSRNVHDKLNPTMNDVETCRTKDVVATVEGVEQVDEVGLDTEDGVESTMTEDEMDEDAENDTSMTVTTAVPLQNARRKYKCYVCNKRFDSLTNCKSHRQEHDQNRHQHKCTVCNTSYPSERMLTQHTTKHHNPENKHKCPRCCKWFITAQSLMKHTLIHDNVREFACNECDRTFTQKEHLTRHIVMIHKPESLRHACELCGKFFYLPSYLTKHMKKSHTVKTGKRIKRVTKTTEDDDSVQEIKKYQCQFCGQVFPDKEECELHLNHVDSSTKEFPCLTCCASFDSELSLDNHLKTNGCKKKFNCADCGKGFHRLVHLRRHERYHSNEEKYKCELCGKNFIALTQLKRHKAAHLGLREHKCPICQKGFNDKEYLNKHLRTHSTYKPVICTICGLRYRRESDLNIHMRNHVEGMPYMCKICGKKYRLQKSLNVHMKSHDPVLQAYCQQCGKGFRDNGTLKRHLMIHSTDKTAQCMLCHKWYRDNIQLQHHMRIHKRGKTFTCSFCTKTFRDRGKLNRHLLKHSATKQQSIDDRSTSGSYSQIKNDESIYSSNNTSIQRNSFVHVDKLHMLRMIDDKIELIDTNQIQDDDMNSVTKAADSAQAQIDPATNLYWSTGDNIAPEDVNNLSEHIALSTEKYTQMEGSEQTQTSSLNDVIFNVSYVNAEDGVNIHDHNINTTDINSRIVKVNAGIDQLINAGIELNADDHPTSTSIETTTDVNNPNNVLYTDSNGKVIYVQGVGGNAVYESPEWQSIVNSM